MVNEKHQRRDSLCVCRLHSNEDKLQQVELYRPRLS